MIIQNDDEASGDRDGNFMRAVGGRGGWELGPMNIIQDEITLSSSTQVDDQINFNDTEGSLCKELKRISMMYTDILGGFSI